MTGSIQARPDRGQDAWELGVDVGRDRRGRVRREGRLFYGSRQAAEEELARLVLQEEEAGQAVPGASSRSWGPTTTFNDAIAGWRDNGWQDLSPLTAARYESLWRLHIRDEVGTRPIVSTGPYELELYFRRLKAAGAGRETVRYVRSVLHRSCRLARKWSGNLLPNPVTDTELPAYSVTERPEPVRAPSLQEVAAVLQAAGQFDVRYAVGLRIIAATGIRRGEACALRWSDVDFDGSSIVVDESVISAPGGAVVKSPKTRASLRRVAVDGETLDALRLLAEVQCQLAELAGAPQEPSAFVLSMEPGGQRPLHPDTLSKAFTKARKSAGVAPDVHLHSLRHFQATALDSVISERQKQARLGWSTEHMARHYTDAVPEDDLRAAEHIGGLLRAALQDEP